MEAARRLELGQWFTPPEVADLALTLALPPAGPARRRARVLDPACGDGVFLARARAAGVAARGLFGVELEAGAARAAEAAVPGAVVARGDILGGAGRAARAAAPGGFDAVVGNPPYVRQERMRPGLKRAVLAAVADDWPALDPAARARLGGRAESGRGGGGAGPGAVPPGRAGRAGGVVGAV